MAKAASATKAATVSAVKRRRPRAAGNQHDDIGASTDAPFRGMQRTVAILDALAREPARLIELTRSLGLPWATLHRTVAQLEKAQLVRKDPATRRYEVGSRLWYLGSAYLAGHRVLTAATPYLSRADVPEGVAVQLVERIDNLAVAIYSAQKLAEDITKAHYGYHFPLHCGSKGQVLLANESAEFIDSYLRRDLERLTSDTIIDPKQLREVLAAVRRQGFALTVADVQPTTGSVAAPIRDAGGRTIAALCYVFRKNLLKNERSRDEMIDHLVHTAQSISIGMGWRPGQS